MGFDDVSPTFCVHPFATVTTEANGAALVCCAGATLHREDGRAHRYDEDSFGDVWRSAALDDIRASMLDGRQHPACAICWRVEASGQRSFRQDSNDTFAADPALREGVEVNVRARDRLPLFVELRPGDLCNLKCVSCQPTYSSSLQHELDRIPDPKFRLEFHPHYHPATREWWRSETFRQTLRELLPRVRRMNVTGGEVTLIERQAHLLEAIVETGHAAHVTLSLFTNGTRFDPDFIALLSRFERVRLSLSIDHVGARFEYIRYPGSWPHVEANLRRYGSLDDRFELVFMPTISALNVVTLDELLGFIGSLNATFDRARFTCYGQVLHDPPHLSFRILPERLKRLARERLTDAKQSSSFWSDEVYSECIRLLDDRPADEVLVEKARRFLRTLDDIRGNRLDDALSELTGCL